MFLKEFKPNNWRNKVQIRQSAKDAWENENGISKRSAGILMHNALARVVDHTQAAGALTGMLSEGLIDNNEKEELNAAFEKLFSVPEIRQFFEKGAVIRNESEILVSGGEHFRPDRVIINNDTAIVIDYKTGIEKGAHKKQLQGYAKLLSGMGYPRVEMYIIYTAECKVEKV